VLTVSLSEKVGRAVARLDLGGKGVVVAVSGGPDSVALLLALARLPVGPLVVAHLNHELRGADSDADEEFVRTLHAALVGQGRSQLLLSCGRRNIASLAQTAGDNLEATARRERYRWLAETARAHGLSLVATGHTTDDQAETVLHRLLRGTGLQGLRGIAERRPLDDGVELVRPLLDVTRVEVLDFLRAEGVAAREDRTNADLRFTRNRIRHELLPYLERHFNPAVRAVLARLAADAGDAFAEEQAAAITLLANAERPRAGPLLIFDLESLRGASRHHVRSLFRHVWQREGWPAGEMTRRHWRRVEAVVFDFPPAVDLPGRIHVRRRGRVVQVGPPSPA
jgi:tRNA(Ile)-lysidine synthase